MATNTYVALRTVTASAASTVTFDLTGITGYTDLVIVAQANSSEPGTSVNSYRVRFNNSSASLYSNTNMQGSGSTTITTRDSDTVMYCGALNQASGIQNISTIHIMNYTSNNYKNVVARGSSTEAVNCNVGLWRSTSPITQIDLFMTSRTLTGTFSLYGIATEGTTPTPKATGGAIYSDSTYYYHVFGSTGVFTPSTSLSADILVVAGGGAGGSEIGGGGGAGGLLAFTSQSLTATNYTCTVGGGASQSSGSTNGANGSNSTFQGLTAAVGGGGGTYYGVTSNTAGGGSAGGGGRISTGGTVSVSGQGNNGGAGAYPTPGTTGGFGGGGGGAGAAGQAVTALIAGNGGIGATSTFINAIGTATGAGQTVSSVNYFAGGGGGGGEMGGTGVGYGLGGSGGGGNGVYGNGLYGNPATINTGGGGGGGSGSSTARGGAGGSGIIVVRYLKA